MVPLGFIRAPTNLGLNPHPVPGREHRPDKLPGALAELGFVERVGAREVAALPRPPYPAAEERADGLRNAWSVQAFTLALADAVDAARAAGLRPLVCGGDCSVLLGCGLALARRGRYGLVFLDAHHDYHHPGNAAAFGAAGADLALVTGVGTPLLADLEGRRPYFREEDVFTFGFRCRNPEDERLFREIRSTRIQWAELADARALGMDWLGRAVAAFFEGREELDGFWVHLDADVLDEEFMPAVDCPEPGGLRPEELTTLLGRLLRSPRCAGLNLTILDPDLDPGGAARRCFADTVAGAFRSADGRPSAAGENFSASDLRDGDRV